MCLKNYVQTCNGKELTSNCVAVYYLMSGTSRIFVFHHIYPQHNLHIQLVGIITNATLITYIDYSITENYRVAQKERIAFQRCPLAPTLIRFICLRFLSLGLPQIKSKVYVRKPRAVDDLEVSIRKEIAAVPQGMSVNVMQNCVERFRTCVRQEGRHLSDIIFRN